MIDRGRADAIAQELMVWLYDREDSIGSVTDFLGEGTTSSRVIGTRLVTRDEVRPVAVHLAQCGLVELIGIDQDPAIHVRLLGPGRSCVLDHDGQFAVWRHRHSTTGGHVAIGHNASAGNTTSTSYGATTVTGDSNMVAGAGAHHLHQEAHGGSDGLDSEALVRVFQQLGALHNVVGLPPEQAQEAKELAVAAENALVAGDPATAKDRAGRLETVMGTVKASSPAVEALLKMLASLIGQ